MTSSETDSFFALTPERVLRAVELLGVRCTGRVLALNSMENRVYQAEIEVPDLKQLSSPYEAYRIVKFYRPQRWTREQILEEHRFLFDSLAQDLPVIAPLRVGAEQESLLVEEESGIYFALFPRCGGRNLPELSDEQLARMGRLVARLHNCGAVRKFEQRLTLDAQSYGLNELKFLVENKIFPAEISERFSTLIGNLCAICERMLSGTSMQRIHGDLHCGNVIWDRDQPSLVDFDDSVRGPAIQDLWLMVPGRAADSQAQWRILLENYEQLRNFDRNELRLIEVMRTLRMIRFNGWIARRWQDPAFQRVFTNFGSNQYWREQLVALSEQAEILQGG